MLVENDIIITFVEYGVTNNIFRSFEYSAKMIILWKVEHYGCLCGDEQCIESRTTTSKQQNRLNCIGLDDPIIQTKQVASSPLLIYAISIYCTSHSDRISISNLLRDNDFCFFNLSSWTCERYLRLIRFTPIVPWSQVLPHRVST